MDYLQRKQRTALIVLILGFFVIAGICYAITKGQADDAEFAHTK